MSQDVVDAARSWIGTPYRHQASCKGGGTDCLGLIRGVWRELFGAEPQVLPAYTPDWSEPSRDEALWRAAAMHLETQADVWSIKPGDVLLFRMRDGCVAKHLGIAAQRDGAASVIHAYCGQAVVESALTEPWRRRVVARFRFPERTL